MLRPGSLRLLALALVGSLALAADAEFKKGEHEIEVLLDGKPFTTFYYGPEEPKPYLHPLRAADGTIVTRQYPMRDDIPGEAHDHPHHRGLWFTHGDVNGIDFWANEAKYKAERDNVGKVAIKGVHKAGDGFIRADFSWLTPDGETILTEDRLMRFSQQGDVRILDFDSTLTATIKPVKFGDTKEGFFAVRIHPSMRETTPDKKPGKGVIVNAEGKKGAKNTWGKASPWVDYSGPIDGKTYGIAIFDHPQNPKHPTYWHVRDYGLFAANQFGEHDFYADESRDGSITIQPGEKLRFRYRVVIHPGDAAAADVAKMYQSWAK